MMSLLFIVKKNFLFLFLKCLQQAFLLLIYFQLLLYIQSSLFFFILLLCFHSLISCQSKIMINSWQFAFQKIFLIFLFNLICFFIIGQILNLFHLTFGISFIFLFVFTHKIFMLINKDRNINFFNFVMLLGFRFCFFKSWQISIIFVFFFEIIVRLPYCKAF